MKFKTAVSIASIVGAVIAFHLREVKLAHDRGFDAGWEGGKQWAFSLNEGETSNDVDEPPDSAQD